MTRQAGNPHLHHIDWARARRMVLVPTVFMAMAFIMVWQSGLHLALADAIFQLEGGRWALKKYWLTQTLLHDQIKHLHTLAIIGLLGYAIRHKIRNPDCHINRANLFLITALLVSYTVITSIKHSLNMDCPWDLNRYGGLYPYIDFLEQRLPMMKRGLCFPAGHASLGYSWLALFFYFLVTRPSLSKWGIVAPALLGLGLGFVQQLRGAHFILDDMATLLICWLCSGLLFLLFYHPRRTTMTKPVTVAVTRDKPL